MAGLDELRQWIARDLETPAVRRHWKIETWADTDTRLTRRIVTADYIFTITADTSLDYLDCVCQTRRHAPGKHHPLFKDLPDGKLTEETWQAIVAEIKRLEIQPFYGPSL